MTRSSSTNTTSISRPHLSQGKLCKYGLIKKQSARRSCLTIKRNNFVSSSVTNTTNRRAAVDCFIKQPNEKNSEHASCRFSSSTTCVSSVRARVWTIIGALNAAVDNCFLCEGLISTSINLLGAKNLSELKELLVLLRSLSQFSLSLFFFHSFRGLEKSWK